MVALLEMVHQRKKQSDQLTDLSAPSVVGRALGAAVSVQLCIVMPTPGFALSIPAGRRFARSVRLSIHLVLS